MIALAGRDGRPLCSVCLTALQPFTLYGRPGLWCSHCQLGTSEQEIVCKRPGFTVPVKLVLLQGGRS